MSFALVSAGFTIPVLMERWDSNVDISPIECNNIECFAEISQPDVIHTTWRRAKSYCSEYSNCSYMKTICPNECLNYTCTEYSKCDEKEITNEFNETIIESCEIECLNQTCTEYSECYEEQTINQSCNVECLTYTDYTLAENQLAIKEYTNKRLRDYADAEEVRKGNSIGVSEKIDAGGSLTSVVESIRK